MRKYLLIALLLIISIKIIAQNRGEYDNINSKLKFILTTKIDYLPSNFNDFESLLGKYNVSAMNTPNGTLDFELGTTYKKYYFGLCYGFVSGGNYDTDSLNVEFKESQYGLSLGYKLIDSKRIAITPKLGIKLHRYKLLNNSIKYEIPIEQYINDRDLDIRFNQYVGLVGLDLSYKFYNKSLLIFDYWAIGFSSGYVVKLNYKTFIYSRGNRLTNNNTIQIGDYNLGLYCSFNFK